MEKSRMLLMVSTEAAQLLGTHPETEPKLYLMLLVENTNLTSVNRTSSGSDEVLSSKTTFVWHWRERMSPGTSDILKKAFAHHCADVSEFSCQPLG